MDAQSIYLFFTGFLIAVAIQLGRSIHRDRKKTDSKPSPYNAPGK